MAKFVILFALLLAIQGSYEVRLGLQGIENFERESTSYKLYEWMQDGDRSYTPKGIKDIIRALKEQIESILHLLSHFPNSIEEIPEKINELLSHININLIIIEIRREVNTAIKDGGKYAEDCRPKAEEDINSLRDTNEAIINKCLEEAESDTEDVKAEIVSLADEAWKIIDDIKDQTSGCFTENKLNPVKIYKCLEEKFPEIQQKIDDLEKRVADVYENSKKEADEIIETLAQCLNTVQKDTINQGQAIIEETETCVRHAHPNPFMEV